MEMISLVLRLCCRVNTSSEGEPALLSACKVPWLHSEIVLKKGAHVKQASKQFPHLDFASLSLIEDSGRR